MQTLNFPVKGLHREEGRASCGHWGLSPLCPALAFPAPEFYQRRSDCFEFNGTHRFLEQYIYNREVYIQFDRVVRVFVAVTKLGRITAKNWNIQREFLELRMSAVDTVCRPNYEPDKGFTLKRRGEGLGGKEKTLEGVGWAAEERRGLFPISKPQCAPGWVAGIQRVSIESGARSHGKVPDSLLNQH